MSYKVTIRDRIAHRLANASLKLATRPYQNYITAVIEMGMKRFDQVAREVAVAESDH